MLCDYGVQNVHPYMPCISFRHLGVGREHDKLSIIPKAHDLHRFLLLVQQKSDKNVIVIGSQFTLCGSFASSLTKWRHNISAWAQNNKS